MADHIQSIIGGTGKVPFTCPRKSPSWHPGLMLHRPRPAAPFTLIILTHLPHHPASAEEIGLRQPKGPNAVIFPC